MPGASTSRTPSTASTLCASLSRALRGGEMGTGSSVKEMEVSCFTNNRSMEVLCIIGAFSHGYVSLLEFKMGIL